MPRTWAGEIQMRQMNDIVLPGQNPDGCFLLLTIAEIVYLRYNHEDGPFAPAGTWICSPSQMRLRTERQNSSPSDVQTV